jgi:hypothetical protein
MGIPDFQKLDKWEDTAKKLVDESVSFYHVNIFCRRYQHLDVESILSIV